MTSTPSANNTVATAPGQTIIDGSNNVWSINAGGQVVVNGTADPTTANVAILAYEDGQVWQENASNLWWAKSSPSDTWSPEYGTPVSPVPAGVTPVSANDTFIRSYQVGAINDANGNVWSISSAGQVLVNSVADPTTANVTALAYVDGQVWQENASDLWWAKSSPGDSWLPELGTPTSPITNRTWLGGSDNAASNPDNWSPAGVPQPGDTLQVSGVTTIDVAGDDLAGDTLNISGGGFLAHNVTINASDNVQLNLSEAASTATLNVADMATLNLRSGFGSYLYASGGTIQFIGKSNAGFGAVFNDDLIGNATLNLSGGPGEGSSVEVNGSVAQGLTFNLSAVAGLILDQPDRFTGSISISNSATSFPLEKVTFAGLTVTSGELLNGVLNLFNGDQLIDSFNVTGAISPKTGGNVLTLDQTRAGVVLSENHYGAGGSGTPIPLTFTS